MAIEHEHDRRRREAIAYGTLVREQATTTTAPSYQVLSASGPDQSTTPGRAGGSAEAVPASIDAAAIYAKRAAAVVGVGPEAGEPVVGAYATGRPLPDADQVYERRRQAVARAAAGG